MISFQLFYSYFLHHSAEGGLSKQLGASLASGWGRTTTTS